VARLMRERRSPCGGSRNTLLPPSPSATAGHRGHLLKMFAADQMPYILAGVVLMTLQPVLVTLSQNSEGKFDYNPVSSTLLSESSKIFISAGFLYTTKQTSAVRLDLKEAMQYAIPAFIYFVNNNLVFVILSHVNPTTFQLLSQLKTAFTGILFAAFLGRRLTVIQWLAIWQLTCGTATSHIPTTSVDNGKESSFVGLCLSVISCMLSACGGIYSEKLLKDKAKDSIHWQNVQLYFWGVLFNLVGSLMHDPGVLFEGGGLLKGYNSWACMVVLNNALNGLAISAILKYADNIARVYAHAAAMLTTMVLSVLLFGQKPTPQLIIAVAIVAASAVQYNLKPEQLMEALSASIAPKTKTEEKGSAAEMATLVGASKNKDDDPS